MSYVILDTNVVVSAMWQQFSCGNPARIFEWCMDNRFALVYSSAIIAEYEDILRRPKFGFDRAAVNALLALFRQQGLVAEPVLPMRHSPLCADTDDQKFYDAARSWDAFLITGNKKHFPEDIRIFTPGEFIARLTLGA